MGTTEIINLIQNEPENIVAAYFKDQDGNPLILTNYQAEFLKKVIRRDHDRFIFSAATQSGKCFGQGTKILMFDGLIKEIQDIKINDLLMGDDSTPRRVLSLCSGIDQLYSVTPRGLYADKYIVNSKHILCLAHRKRGKKIDYCEMGIEDFINLPVNSKTHGYFGYQRGVFFTHKETKLEPYFLGIWLGDGHSRDTQITSVDKEISKYLYDYAERIGLKVSTYVKKGQTRIVEYGLRGKPWHTNSVWDEMKHLNLVKNKHIPQEYLFNSEHCRLELLAGLIDTDGHASKQRGKENTCEITFSNKRLADDTLFLVRSLGFRASLSPKKASCQTGFVGVAYRIRIYGELWIIPTKIQRKKFGKNKLFNIPSNYGITVEPIGTGEYFGFVLDGNKRFLLSDFTVVHNTEVISCILALMAILYPNERIVNISCTEQQAKIMFERTKAHLVEDSPIIKSLVDLSRNIGSSREFSRTRMFMKNGTDLRILSTGKGETETVGTGLLGHNASILVVDEASSIPDEIFRTKILRMLGARKTTGFKKILILSSTPNTSNFFEDCWNDPDYIKLHVDWKMAVDAGRMDLKTVMEQKRKMPRSEFESWYEAKFPGLLEDSMYDIDECKANVVPQDLNFYGKKILSVDISRFGSDLTVYTCIDKVGDTFRVVDFIEDRKKGLMTTTGNIIDLNKQHHFDTIIVDASGVGGGVMDRLTEQGIEAVGVIAGSRCTSDETAENCLNLKAELHSKAKRLFEQNKLKIIDKGSILTELRKIKKDKSSDGKLKIVDPDKSPDYVDSLIYGLYEYDTGTFVVVDMKPTDKTIWGRDDVVPNYL